MPSITIHRSPEPLCLLISAAAMRVFDDDDDGVGVGLGLLVVIVSVSLCGERLKSQGLVDRRQKQLRKGKLVGEFGETRAGVGGLSTEGAECGGKPGGEWGTLC